MEPRQTGEKKLYRNHPEDLIPSRIGELSAHMGTVLEFTLPLLPDRLIRWGDRDDRRGRDGDIPPSHPLDLPLAVPLEGTSS